MLYISEKFPATCLTIMAGTVLGSQTVGINVSINTPNSALNFFIQTHDAEISPPLQSGVEKMSYIAAEAYLNVTGPLPQFGLVIIENGFLRMQLFATNTSTDIIGIIESGEEMTLPDKPFPEHIVIQRRPLEWRLS